MGIHLTEISATSNHPPPPHRKTETKMFLSKLIVATFVALASAQEEQSPSSYANYLTGGFQQPLYQGQQQSYPLGADKRQGFNMNNIDGVTAAALSGGANAVYTTVGLLSVNSRTTNNCHKINEMLNVADLATQTVTVGDASTNAGLTSTQTAITAIVA